MKVKREGEEGMFTDLEIKQVARVMNY